MLHDHGKLLKINLPTLEFTNKVENQVLKNELFGNRYIKH